MKAAYYDTTFLIKVVCDEAGSVEVRAHAEKKSCLVCSLHGRVEFIAACHRKFREGVLTKAQVNKIVLQLHEDTRSGLILWLPISDKQIVRLESAFQKALPTTFLRAADALHLATAVEHGFSEIYSNDRHLLAAAPLFDLKGINLIS